MPELLVVAALLAGVVVITPFSDWARVPQPVVLTLFGLAVALLPGVPDLGIRPELILPVVLPPLLFAATQRTTAGEFRDSIGPILLLAVGLTTATTAVVAVVSHAAGLGWPVAWVLGAVVSPPDPVAATAVARRLRLPHRMVTVLEGEGMFNDATALVLYKVAVVGVVSGAFSVGEAALELVLAVVVGVGLGLVVGWLATAALAALHDASAETTVSVAIPFVAYLGAEQLRGSGVLAVLVMGLYVRRHAHPATTSEGWLLGRAVWQYADFLITSLTFALVGFGLTRAVTHSSVDSDTFVLAGAVLATLVVFRALWMFPAVGVMRALQRRRRSEVSYSLRETAVVSWAGMRGVVTVATALALPTVVDSGSAFPQRQSIVVVALLCVLLTLGVQGLSLSPLVSALGVGAKADTTRAAARLRRRAVEAALRHLREKEADADDQTLRAVRHEYEAYLSAHAALDRSGTEGEDEEALSSRKLQELRSRLTDVERDLVLDARRTGRVSSATADAVLRDIETRAVFDYE